MNKRILGIIFIAIILLGGCQSKKATNENEEINIKKATEVSTMKIEINDQEYIMDIENNSTVSALISMLPLELEMKELNGNEKYIYLDQSLPTNESNIKHISAGDVMLFSDNCLVIFYKSFDTTYNYTKIGHIDNLPDLGNNNINIKLLID